MANRPCGRILAAAFFLSCLSAAAQAPWTVRPEWVRAHEEFLASDALHGRGSATPDEGVAAQYVGTQFEAYGLKPVNGTYVQKIGISEPEVDGHSTLRMGPAGELQEKTDYDLVRWSGEGDSGPLVKVSAGELDSAKPAAGSVVLVTGTPELRALAGASRRLATLGIRAVMAECPALHNMFEKEADGETDVASRLAGSPPDPSEQRTLLVLTNSAAGKMGALADGSEIALSVHAKWSERTTYNAIGVLPGSDAQAHPILLTAHLDHLGIGRPVNGDDIYNGANDDASGTTAVMELAHALAAGRRPRRTVYFVCFGSEETGQFGDRYFRDHPPVALTDFAANVEFEMLAEQDPGLPKGTMFMTGWERSNLGPALKQHGAHIVPDPYLKQRYFERSDNYTLAKAGVVAQTIGGANMEHYHQPSDDLAHADLELLRSLIQSLIEPVRWLANSEFTPAWNAGGRP
ncbi:MAG TPA: M28 family peptidase [Terriglobales bacterium]|nr:M28 family peptidase [Terriglobales bacterium]